MALRKRCIFCHKPVDKKGLCQNKSCIDYLRTQIVEAAEAKRKAEAEEKAKEEASSTTTDSSNTGDTATTTKA